MCVCNDLLMKDVFACAVISQCVCVCVCVCNLLMKDCVCVCVCAVICR